MVTSSKHHTIRIAPEQHQRLMALASQREWSPSRVIREALAAYLIDDETRRTSDRRQIRTGEFSHLVLDFIMRRQFPDSRDRLIAELERCMELYHGA